MKAPLTSFVLTALLCTPVFADDWSPSQPANPTTGTQRTALQFQPAPPRPLRENTASVRAAGHTDDFEPRGVQRAQFSNDDFSGTDPGNVEPPRFGAPRTSQLDARVAVTPTMPPVPIGSSTTKTVMLHRSQQPTAMTVRFPAVRGVISRRPTTMQRPGVPRPGIPRREDHRSRHHRERHLRRLRRRGPVSRLSWLHGARCRRRARHANRRALPVMISERTAITAMATRRGAESG